MKFTVAAAAAALVQVASAHYWYDVSIYNGQSSSSYIRKPQRGQLYNPIKFSSNPAGDIKDGSTIDGPDSRCNQNAFRSAGSTNVLSVTAGSSLQVKLAYGENIEHPGPTLVYMSRAPGDNVKAYDGSGDWFKIYQDGVCNQGGDFTKGAWCSYLKTTLQATIPKNTPNGEYLVRFEHIGIHRSHVNQPEHYVGCVQVKVTGGGNGSPGPMVKFPGAYRSNDGYATFNIYGGYKSFPFPGPAVWNGSGSSGPSPSPPPSGNPPPSNPPPSSPPPSSGCSALYGQCGGSGYTGPKCCSAGSCKVSNEWYSQCL